MRTYYLVHNCDRFGPLTENDLRARCASGEFLPTDSVLPSDGDAWITAGDIPGLFTKTSLETEGNAYQGSDWKQRIVAKLQKLAISARREALETARIWSEQLRRLLAYSRGLWQKHVISTSAIESIESLGRDLNSHSHGDAAIRDEIKNLDHQIMETKQQNRSVWGLERRRALLCKTLAESYLQSGDETSTFVNQADRIRDLLSAKVSHEQQLRRQWVEIIPTTQADRWRVVISLTALGVVLFSMVSLYTRKQDSTLGNSDNASESVYDAPEIAHQAFPSKDKPHLQNGQVITDLSFESLGELQSLKYHPNNGSATAFHYVDGTDEMGNATVSLWAGMIDFRTGKVSNRVQLIPSVNVDVLLPQSYDQSRPESILSGLFPVLGGFSPVWKLSRDGNLVATLDPQNGTLKVIDIQRATTRFSRQAHRGGKDSNESMMTSGLIRPQLVFSTCGNYIATSHFDGTTRFWDARSGESFSKPLTGSDPLSGVRVILEFDALANTLLEVSDEGVVQRSLKNGTVVIKYPINLLRVSRLPLSQVIFGEIGEKIVAANRRTGEVVHELGPSATEDGELVRIAPSASGKWVALQRTNALVVIDASNSKLIGRHELKPGTLLLTGDGDELVRPTQHWACLSADGKQLALGTFDESTNIKRQMIAQIWDISTHRQLAVLQTDADSFEHNEYGIQNSVFIPFRPGATYILAGIPYRIFFASVDAFRDLTVFESKKLTRVN